MSDYEKLMTGLFQRLKLKSVPDPSENDVPFQHFTVSVEYRPATESVRLMTCLAHLPQAQPEALMIQLLKGQFLFQETGGATLAVTHGGLIILQCELPLVTLELDRLCRILENFLDTAEHWRDRCRAAG